MVFVAEDDGMPPDDVAVPDCETWDPDVVADEEPPGLVMGVTGELLAEADVELVPDDVAEVVPEAVPEAVTEAVMEPDNETVPEEVAEADIEPDREVVPEAAAEPVPDVDVKLRELVSWYGDIVLEA